MTPAYINTSMVFTFTELIILALLTLQVCTVVTVIMRYDMTVKIY